MKTEKIINDRRKTAVTSQPTSPIKKSLSSRPLDDSFAISSESVLEGSDDRNAHCAAIDLNYTPMHLMINTVYLKALSKHAVIDLYDWGAEYKEIYSDRILPYQIKCITSSTRSPLFSRIICFLNLVKNAITIGAKKHEKVFVLGYDLISFSLGRFLLPGADRLFVIHHMQVDEAYNAKKRFFFNLFCNSINHIVLSENIRQSLINDFRIDPLRVNVLNHPSYEYDTSKIKPKKSRKLFIGFSYSNDEDMISQIIAIEKNTEILKRAGCELVLKSKINEYENGFLKVFRGNLPRKEYDMLFKDSMGIVVLLGPSFKNRISGIMIDGLSYGKVVFGNEAPCLMEYASRYPGACITSQEVGELLNSITSYDGSPIPPESHGSFMRDGSLEKISEQAAKLWICEI